MLSRHCLLNKVCTLPLVTTKTATKLYLHYAAGVRDGWITDPSDRRETQMKDAQKPDHVSLNTLINRLKEGRFVIPDFQREFEWRPWDIRELMRSVFLDYYIGSLLLWKGKRENFSALSCE